MTVTSLLLWEDVPGQAEKYVAAAKKAKKLLMKHGGEDLRLGRVMTGQYTGQWLIAARFGSMEAFGKTMDVLSADPAYVKLMASVPGKLLARNIVSGIDL